MASSTSGVFSTKNTKKCTILKHFHTQAYSFKTACSKSIFRESNIPPLPWLRPAIPLSRFLVNNLTHSPSCWFCCCWHSVIAQCWGCCAYCCCCEGPKITLSCLVRGKLGWQHQVSSKVLNQNTPTTKALIWSTQGPLLMDYLKYQPQTRWTPDPRFLQIFLHSLKVLTWTRWHHG